MNKFSALRGMLNSDDLEFIMEAHNGLSAKIVEQTGFKAIWGSGLSMSSTFGVRDRNEASWTQVLDNVEFMADATNIPILMDGDTGYGDFNNVARLTRKLCQRGVAGVCIEDKMFPKQNSFIGDAQDLIGIEDFTAKIKASKDNQSHNDFSLVARIEALVSGLSMDEAIDRAGHYHEAGADAILIHSKKSTSDEIEEFCRQWQNRCPVVVVPTKYFGTPTSKFRESGISVAIWANHNVRASISAMKSVCETIFNDETLTGVEPQITPVSEIFELTGETSFDTEAQKYFKAAVA